MSNELVTRMLNAVTDANSASQITYQVLTGALDSPVSTEEGNIPTLSTRVRDFLEDLLNGGDLNGEDGLSITDVTIDSNGHLFVTIEGQAPKDLGKIIPDNGVGVNTVRFNSTNGSVEFELDDNRTITLNNIAGDDGITVEQALIRTGDLILVMSDGNEINAGDISQFGGTSASDAEINEQGQLVIIFSDGTTKVIGQVVGPRGKDGVSTIAGFIDANGVLRFYRSDGSQYNAGQAIVPILDASGNTVEGARIVNKELVLELSTGDYTVGQIVGNDGTNGIDGVSVEEVYIDDTDNNLYVRLTGQAAQAVGEVRNTIFENADVAVTNATINGNGELILDISVNGAVTTETIGKVVGENGRVFVSADFDNVTGILTFTDDASNTITAGTIEQVTVTGASVDGTTGMLTINLSNGTSIDAGIVRGSDGLDGTGITNAYLDSGGDLYVVFDDPTIPDALVGNFMAPVETAASFNVNDELIITMSDGQEFNLGKVKGVDGTYVENAKIVNDEILIDFSDGTTDVVVGNVQNIPSAASVDKTDGTLTIDFTNGASVTTSERVRGLDGDTITDIRFDSDPRNLIIDLSTDNTNTTSKVTVPMVRGRSVDDIAYDDITRKLTLTTNVPAQNQFETNLPISIDSSTITDINFDASAIFITTNIGGGTIETVDYPEEVDGATVIDVQFVSGKLVIDTDITGNEIVEIDFPMPVDGESVIDVRIESNQLIIETTIVGSERIEVDLPDSLSVTDVTLDANNNLVVDLSDGRQYVIDTIEGYIGIGIDTIDFNGQDLNISITDGTTVNIPAVRGVDGDGITDISIDGTDLVITTTLSGTPLRFPQLKGTDAPNTIESVSLVGNDLVFNLIDAPDVTVPMVRGEDGDSVLSASFDGNDLVITTNVLGQETITIPSVRGDDGNSLLDITLETNGDITLTTNISTLPTVTLPSVKGVDGVDGKNIDSVVINTNDELVVTMDDDPTTPTVYTIPGVGTAVTDAEIDSTTGQLVLTLSDTTTLTTTDSIKGRDGNGTGIKTATFTNGQLSFVLSDAAGVETNVDAGSVEMTSVTNVRIDEQNQGSEGILVFEMSDATEIPVGNVYGKDGRYVSSTAINTNGELILTMSDGTTVNAGNSLGDDGVYVSSAEVLFSGDLLLTMSDGTTQNAGSIGSGAGLTVWRIEDVPYVKDRVVIYDGGLYMSEIDNNNDEPPSGNWTPLALGDQLIEVRPPRVESPINGDTAYSIRPTLVASPYAAIVSIDERDYREWQITSITDTTFATPLFTYQNDKDYIEVLDDLTVSTSYLWRCRDTSTRGYVSGWSNVGEFNVPAGIIETPTVTISPDEDVNSAFAAPKFISSAFVNNFNSEVHTETDWRIVDAATNTIVYESLNDTVNLLELIVPFGILVESTNYEISIKHRAGTIESPWSTALLFTTEATFDYVDKPVVYYDGDINQVSLFDATFNSSTFRKSASFAVNTTNIPLIHATSGWEVANADTGAIVDSFEGSTALTSYTVSVTLQNNINYRVRVRYTSERFGSSEWSDWLNFNAEQSIATPTISTTEDVNGFPSGGIFTSTPFSGINEEHISTDWEVRNFFTDVVVWESLNDIVNLTTLSFDAAIAADDYVIRVRYNGNNVSSEWSNSLDFYYGTPV